MKILIAVDEKALAEVLVEFITSHRWIEPVEFKILNVLEQIKPVVGKEPLPPNALSLELLEERRHEGLNLVSHIAAEVKAVYPEAHVAAEVVEGHPKDAIIEEAEEWQADTIVVGAHGYRGIVKAILGSVSSSVVCGADCSVIVVKAAKKTSNNSARKETCRSEVNQQNIFFTTFV